jgi:hypothetical protein
LKEINIILHAQKSKKNKRNMKGSMIPSKDKSNSSEIDLSLTDIYQIPAKEFKIMIQMKLSGMQRNREKQYKEMRKNQAMNKNSAKR